MTTLLEKMNKLRDEKEEGKRRKEEEHVRRLKDGLLFCESYGIDIVPSKRGWDDIPPTEAQMEALRRFNPEFGIRKYFQTKEYAQEHLNKFIDEARKLHPRTWPDTETLKASQQSEGTEWRSSALGRDSLRKEALAFLGGKCFVCGADNPADLEIDHRNGDGSKHRREVGLAGVYKDVLQFGRAEFQLLCGTHHNIKTAEDRERNRRNA